MIKNKKRQKKIKDSLEYPNYNKKDIRHYDITLFRNRNGIHLEFQFQKRHTDQMKPQKIP